jgi:hypothetical protein
LSFVEVAHRPNHDRDVALLLPKKGRGRVFPGSSQIGAISRTANLHDPLGSTAHGADLPTKGRTCATSLSEPTKGAGHGPVL